jgi:hypothetical protein
MMQDWENPSSPTKRDMEKRRSVEQAILDIGLAAQGKPPSQSLTKSLAIVLLEIHREAERTSRDMERALTGVQAILRALANDHEDVRDYLRGRRKDVHRRGDEPSLKR